MTFNSCCIISTDGGRPWHGSGVYGSEDSLKIPLKESKWEEHIKSSPVWPQNPAYGGAKICLAI